jgi:hypothetical protein
VFNFTCKDVGYLYEPTLTVSFSFEREQYTLDVPDLPKYICPESVTVWWSYDPGEQVLTRVGEYVWTGEGYEYEPEF